MSDKGWLLEYEGYEPQHEGLRETLCALGNGYFCTRGAAPDVTAGKFHYPGSYLAGGYNRLTTEIEGREIENEDLVNIPNWLVLMIRVDDGPWLNPDQLTFMDYRQVLDLRRGVLSRTLRFCDDQDRITRVEERRFVSMVDAHLAGLEVTITAENWSGCLTVRSGLDGTVTNMGVARYQSLRGRHLEPLDAGAMGNEIIWLRSRTVQSRIEIAQAARTRLYHNGRVIHPDHAADVCKGLVAQEVSVDVAPGDTTRVEKIASLFTSRDRGISEPLLAAKEKLPPAGDFDALLASHENAWQHLWELFELEIDSDGGVDLSMKLRLHVFHLLQTVTRHTNDLDVGVPPRGWNGEAYRAHIMWDELFIFPLIVAHAPARCRALLQYRYRRLPAARSLAREAGFSGAMFPWQSGSSGREESQVLHLNPESGRWIPDNSNRQRHVNSAIVYNLWHYYEVSGDCEFMEEYGAEMLLEIARFWAGIVSWNAQRGRYDICRVMGPDEYHTAYPGADPSTEGGLDNNAYTNVMAAWVLTRACQVLEILPPDRARQLCEELGITGEEVERWHDVSRKLFVPLNEEGIISQFEGYEDLEEFDWNGARKKYGDIHRLDRILEAEGDDTNRYKASKQADVLMLFYLFTAEELKQIFEQLGYPFDPHTIPRNVDYYLHRTSHGSTLSWVLHSWVLARSDRQHSWQLFQNALDSDISDIQGGTTPEGIHLGAMAGTVDLIQRCYLGLEVQGDVLFLNPTLPDEIHRLKTCLWYRRQKLDLEVTKDRLRVSSRQLTADPVTIAYRGLFHAVSPGSHYQFRLIKH
ncbi:glycosyl hydrolase family 65 protein [Marinobacter sp. HL-58]|uniref:glycoside hydrolase family 65 protein n=1 Tax=Marinobacter sp. HL-58 TaxID=1479237 RepID=UPI0006DB6992|nr:glycosyl hydrolase family 65 protein [Marinobacter sp. HL-58]KPP98875.1 MAG: Trehalose and maltose hydrolases (possible phosphorylases) [Marinobacter sp. HL-58]